MDAQLKGHIEQLRQRCREIRCEFQVVHKATDWPFGKRVDMERELIDEFAELTAAFFKAIAARKAARV